MPLPFGNRRRRPKGDVLDCAGSASFKALRNGEYERSKMHEIGSPGCRTTTRPDSNRPSATPRPRSAEHDELQSLRRRRRRAARRVAVAVALAALPRPSARGARTTYARRELPIETSMTSTRRSCQEPDASGVVPEHWPKPGSVSPEAGCPLSGPAGTQPPPAWPRCPSPSCVAPSLHFSSYTTRGPEPSCSAVMPEHGPRLAGRGVQRHSPSPVPRLAHRGTAVRLTCASSSPASSLAELRRALEAEVLGRGETEIQPTGRAVSFPEPGHLSQARRSLHRALFGPTLRALERALAKGQPRSDGCSRQKMQ